MSKPERLDPSSAILSRLTERVQRDIEADRAPLIVRFGRSVIPIGNVTIERPLLEGFLQIRLMTDYRSQIVGLLATIPDIRGTDGLVAAKYQELLDVVVAATIPRVLLLTRRALNVGRRPPDLKATLESVLRKTHICRIGQELFVGAGQLCGRPTCRTAAGTMKVRRWRKMRPTAGLNKAVARAVSQENPRLALKMVLPDSTAYSTNAKYRALVDKLAKRHPPVKKARYRLKRNLPKAQKIAPK